MFDCYSYIEKKLPVIIPDAGLNSVSGLGELEELLLEKVRDKKDIEICVEDIDLGNLDFNEGFTNVGYFSFYVLVKATLNSESRRKAKSKALTEGFKLLKEINKDSKEYDSPTYGLDKKKINYIGVGPVAENYHGYHMSFIIKNEIGL
ncbi:MAG: hypothetical protein N4A72_00910 [Bacteroidales bacterium]|jgi:hypothetical protein|nr:hypothetical protein [Bacteroidales bacterium]